MRRTNSERVKDRILDKKLKSEISCSQDMNVVRRLMPQYTNHECFSVYILLDEDTGTYKIGETLNLYKRIRDLSEQLGRELKLIGTFLGRDSVIHKNHEEIGLERAFLHNYFNFPQYTEWYDMNPELEKLFLVMGISIPSS